MAKFLEGAGCVRKIKGSGEHSFKIEGWETGQLKSGLIVIDSIEPTEREIAVPVVCVDNFRVLYRFGKNFGALTVTGKVYLGSSAKGKAASTAMKTLKSSFEKIRLSSTKKPKKVSATDGFTCKAYFVELKLGAANAEFHYIEYTLQGIIAPEKK